MKQFSMVSNEAPSIERTKFFSSIIIRPASLTIGFLLYLTIVSKGQNISPVKFSVGADVKVFVTQDSSTADLMVYLTQDTTGIGPNNGIWYFGNDPTKKKVYFADDTTSIDFKVYFTGNASNAGWVNSSKSYLMN